MRGTRRPSACVLGRIDLVRALGVGGITSAVVAAPDDPIRFSRFVTEVIDDEPATLLDRLVTYGERQAEPPVLYWDSDETLFFVSRNRSRLGSAFRFVLAREDLVEQVLDKARFDSLALELGLPVPATSRLDPTATPPFVDRSLAFPCIVKAAPYRDKRWDLLGPTKVLVVRSQAELNGLLPRLAESGLSFIAQELVPGGEDRIESYHVYVDDRGEVAGEFTGRKIRTQPPRFGMSSALETTDHQDVRDLGRDTVERLGVNGVAKIDFKRAPDGRLWLLEVNARFTLWVHLGAVAGVNLPALVYADLTGTPRPPQRRARPGVRWVWPRADAASARAQGVPMLPWALWALRAETNAAWSWRDSLPYVWGRLGWPLYRRARAGVERVPESR